MVEGHAREGADTSPPDLTMAFVAAKAFAWPVRPKVGANPEIHVRSRVQNPASNYFPRFRSHGRFKPSSGFFLRRRRPGGSRNDAPTNLALTSSSHLQRVSHRRRQIRQSETEPARATRHASQVAEFQETRSAPSPVSIPPTAAPRTRAWTMTKT